MLNRVQIEQFRRDGYLVMPGLLDPHGLHQAERLFTSVSAQTPPPADMSLWSSAPDGELYHQARDFLDRSIVQSLATSLLRPELKLTNSPGFQFIVSHVGRDIAPSAIRPHIDGIQTDPDGPPVPFSVQAGIWLTDFPPSSGNLVVWPESHLALGELLAREGVDAMHHRRDDGHGQYPAGVEIGTPTVLTGPAGTVVFAHYLLAHATAGHTRLGARRKIYCRYETTSLGNTRDYVLTDPTYELA